MPKKPAKRPSPKSIAAIDKYGKAYRRYLDVKSIRKTADIKEPGKLDLAPLAAKYNFPIGETPLVDQFEIAKHEIGQKVQQFDMAAAPDAAIPHDVVCRNRLSARISRSISPKKPAPASPTSNYIYFRTAEEKPADVTLKEARPQVVEFWKKQKAFELALTDAKKLAEKAKAAASLAEVVPMPAKVITPPPFSWMTSRRLWLRAARS